MSIVRYVNIIKVALFNVTSDPFIKVANDLSLYVGSSLSVLVMVFQSLSPSFDAHRQWLGWLLSLIFLVFL